MKKQSIWQSILLSVFFMLIFLFTACELQEADFSIQKQMLSVGDKQTFVADGVSFNMVYVPGKRFKTGLQDDGFASVKNDYWIGETEITFQLWLKVKLWSSFEKYGDKYCFASLGEMGHAWFGANNQ